MPAIATLTTDSAPCVRRRIRVRGVVQGVGFRPFVYRLARELGLVGWVRNDAAGVEIEVQGAAGDVGALLRRLHSDAPPLARVDALNEQACLPHPEADGFLIADSGGGVNRTAIGHDTAVCADCLAEMFDLRDRRYRYAFINCTQCGPRYTLTRSLPYDRATTSMARFAQCPQCLAEYTAPQDRRFHAEPNACPVCGPRLSLRAADGRPIEADDVIAQTVRLLRAGRIVATKGIGGFHLACDARNAAAMRRLRSRKAREEKPFAVMMAGLASARLWAHIDDAEARLLVSPERPIVLLRKRDGVDAAMQGVAPGVAWLGIMLPYAPLHYLLFHEAAGRPAGSAWLDAPQPLALIMTSANPGGEPLVTDNDEALRRLQGIADAFLMHDRDIVVRCDDSVVRSDELRRTDREETEQHHASPVTCHLRVIRRARGYTPRAIKLAHDGPPVLALGGYFKNTVCLTRGDEAFVSQHIGDLDNAATCEALLQSVDHLQRLLDVQPQMVAHDLHPDFFGTRHGVALAQRLGVPAIAVQHHHAHIAAVLAEHGMCEPAIGLALDGVGLGSDGTAWGGELLRVDGAQCQRLGHLRSLPLPGGDRAAREPWRMAVAVLHLLGRSAEIGERFKHQAAAQTVAQMLARAINAPPTSSMGRWFDAAAGLLGVREIMAFEGQAAMLLEGLAARHGPTRPLAGGWHITADNVLDLTPMYAVLSLEADAARGAAEFHATLAAALADWVAGAATDCGLRTVALGGGCFLNDILTRDLSRRLAARGYAVLAARQLPPNDGGLALGQAWVARHRVDR